MEMYSVGFSAQITIHSYMKMLRWRSVWLRSALSEQIKRLQNKNQKEYIILKMKIRNGNRTAHDVF